jgi:hypothetical protein
MKPTAIFISNKNYFDNSKQEGGVRQCTLEYLTLIETIYEVIIFKVDYDIDLIYRLRVKFGLNIYNDYKPKHYKQELIDLIKLSKANIVFLNLSNTAPFSKVIKNEFGDKVKVVLCSHGNESGDLLHETVRFRGKLSFVKKLFSSFTLGSVLQKESFFRQSTIDAVLTVSEIEESIEKWIGCRYVLMIPRSIELTQLNHKPVLGRVGFMGDLSHAPNLYGIDEVCKSISNHVNSSKIHIHIVGSPSSIGESLSKKYPFVHYIGYLDEENLVKQASTWTFFLNPVFYYSRGVSTKLAKALGWNIPIITTTIGCRGYVWNEGSLIFAETPQDFCNQIFNLSNDTSAIQSARKERDKIISSSYSLLEISNKLRIFLQKI